MICASVTAPMCAARLVAARRPRPATTPGCRSGSRWRCVSGCSTGSPRDDRRRARRLPAEHARRARGAARAPAYSRVAPPVGGDVAGVADRDAVDVGRVAEHVDDLERGGLLALDAQRVHRVDDLDAGPLAQLAHDLERVGRSCRAPARRCAPWMSACASLPSAIWPSGITTAHVQPGARRVRRGRRRRVAGGRADHDLGARARPPWRSPWSCRGP